MGSKKQIYENPTHIYTKRLIAAILDIDPDKREKSQKVRENIADEYNLQHNLYYTKDNQVYDLKKIDDSHYVAIP
jgi:peptide/nickel transport system ATP-binding protein